MRYFLTLFSLVIFFSSCEEQFKDEAQSISQKTIDDSTDIFAGEVLKKSSWAADNSLWELTIKNADGAAVIFYWKKSTNLLTRLEGTQGPYNYDLNPANGTISLASAKFLAYESISEKVLDSWSLYRLQDIETQWVYEFRFLNDEPTILLDASSGEVL